ncbi:MAG: PKD domain-containing protein, partial [Methanobacteriota archaeon]
FVFSPPNARAGDPVSFAASASGGTPPYAFTWDFGDAGTGAGMFANHTFSAEATYTVTLTVTDAASGLGIVAKSVPIRRAAVVGNVTAAFDAEVNGLSVMFVDRSVSDTGAAIVRWLWAFGDDTSSTEARPNHTYRFAGFFATFTVLLYAYDAEGNVGSTSRDVMLTNGPLLFGTTGVILVAVAVPIVVIWWLRRRKARRRT